THYGESALQAYRPARLGLTTSAPQELVGGGGTEPRHAAGAPSGHSFCPLSACIEAECTAAGRTDLEVYVSLLPKGSRFTTLPSLSWGAQAASGTHSASLPNALRTWKSSLPDTRAPNRTQ